MSLNFLYTGVSWVLLRWHQLFTLLGLSEVSGLNWALSIIFLVITARLLLFRFFLKQVHYQRNMQEMQPRLQAIKETYKNDRQAQQQEMLRLQQEEDFNPLTGCLPMLLQIPIFISLFHVLRHVSNSASLCHPIQVQNTKLSLYGFTATQTCSAADAKLFGAPLAGSLTDSRHTIESTISGTYTSTLIVTIIVVIISAAATYYTQRLVKAGNPTQPEGTAATVQKLMAVGIPISVVISGLFFPLGVLIYWFTSNAWTMGQQPYINKFHPHLPPPDAAAGTGDEDPINPNGGHPTTPDRTTDHARRGRASGLPGHRANCTSATQSQRQEGQTNRRSSVAGGAAKTRPVNPSPRLTSHLGRARRILSSQPQQGPAQQSGSSVRSSQRTISDQTTALARCRLRVRSAATRRERACGTLPPWPAK